MIRTVADHLLATLASVPAGQSIIARASDEVLSNLRSLGFVVETYPSGNEPPDTSCHWGVVVLEGAAWSEAVDTALKVASRVRDGGWLFVGVSRAPDGPPTEDPGALLDRAITGQHYAIAEGVSKTPGDGGVSIRAIIRRVNETASE